MARRKRIPRTTRLDGPLEAYRRVRKPMPPPERVIPDARRKESERVAAREALQQELEAQAGRKQASHRPGQDAG